jgi:hypothetical protein
MITLFNDCEEYLICGCETVDADLHCLYCCEPPARHSDLALEAFLGSSWPDDDKQRVMVAIDRAKPAQNRP